MSDENKTYDKGADGKPLTLEERGDGGDGRLFSPSTGRNKDAVRDVFLAHMPPFGCVLEIASGTGEHGAHIVAAAQELIWTYSDVDEAGMVSQRAWAAHEGQDRLQGPLRVDTTAAHWGEAEAAAPYGGMFCANMIHIAPFEAAIGLFAGAGRLLRRGGRLFLYGPFGRDGEMAPSNRDFVDSLQRRDPRWGVRDLERDILPLAQANGLNVADIIEMPANNLSVIFEKV
jgi:hypothetical protein